MKQKPKVHNKNRITYKFLSELINKQNPESKRKKNIHQAKAKSSQEQNHL